MDLAAVLEQGRARFGVPGAQLGLLRRGRRDVLCAGERGVGGPPVLPSTPFHAGSIAKSLAATLALDAGRRGELDVDVPADRQGADGFDDTLRALMGHTSGRPELLPGADEPLDRFVARVAGLPRAHAQGLFSYSNAVWPVVDLVLQRATGRDFEVLAAERLLGPLGVEPRFGEPVDGATPHRVAGPGEPPLPVAALGARAASAAGSRWWATAEDLLALAEVHLAEGAGLVHGGAVREQREVHVPVPQRGFADGWALGWASWRRGTYRAVGWNGYTNGHRAFLRIFPEQDAALALMTNGAGPLFGGAGGTALFDLVLPACADALGVPVPAAPAGQGEVHRPAGELAGRYGPATVRDAGDGLLLLEASFMGLAAPLRLARAYGTAFMAEPARPGGMPIVFEHDLLYLGPFALPRTGSI